jgi:hypothetical protein
MPEHQASLKAISTTKVVAASHASTRLGISRSGCYLTYNLAPGFEPGPSYKYCSFKLHRSAWKLKPQPGSSLVQRLPMKDETASRRMAGTKFSKCCKAVYVNNWHSALQCNARLNWRRCGRMDTACLPHFRSLESHVGRSMGQLQLL